jgi:hypothetical protein
VSATPRAQSVISLGVCFGGLAEVTVIAGLVTDAFGIAFRVSAFRYSRGSGRTLASCRCVDIYLGADIAVLGIRNGEAGLSSRASLRLWKS